MKIKKRNFKGFLSFFDEEYQKNNGVVLVWGRFNPPTRGHELVFNKAAQIANKYNYVLRIFTSHTQDNKKNPLTYKEKVKFLKLFFPRYKHYIVNDKEEEIQTLIDVFKYLSNKFSNLIMVVGEDRVDEYKNILDNNDYNFKHIHIISAGIRDPESNDISGVSASSMRDAVKNGNKKIFLRNLPKHIKFNIASKLYNIIKLRLGSSVILPNESTTNIMLKHTESREKYYNNKEYFKIGDKIIINKTGNIGIIKSIGSNYINIIESDSNNKTKRYWPNNLTVMTNIDL